jgi:hypothetical protein
MTAEEWAALGVLSTIAVGMVGWLLKVLADRRSDQVRLAISAPTFHTADQDFNPDYAFSVGAQVINTGPGAAYHVAIGTVDTDQNGIYAEWQTLPAMNAGDEHITFLGMHAETAADDPEPQQAWDYYERLILIVTCWDRRGRQYMFTPAGGGSRRRTKLWKNPNEMYNAINSGEPARGDPPRARGIGKGFK